jgi:hypothetical protein
MLVDLLNDRTRLARMWVPEWLLRSQRFGGRTGISRKMVDRRAADPHAANSDPCCVARKRILRRASTGRVFERI